MFPKESESRTSVEASHGLDFIDNSVLFIAHDDQQISCQRLSNSPLYYLSNQDWHRYARYYTSHEPPLPTHGNSSNHSWRLTIWPMTTSTCRIPELPNGTREHAQTLEGLAGLWNKREHSGSSVVVTQIESAPIDRAWQRAITHGWLTFSMILASIVSQAWCCHAKRSCTFQSSTVSLASMSSHSLVLAATWLPCLLSSKRLSLLGESANSNVSHSKVSIMNESCWYESSRIRLRANKPVVVDVDGSLEEETKRLVDMVDVMDSGRTDWWWKIDFTI